MSSAILNHPIAQRILLLQGPVGPFFHNFKKFLFENGAERVIKLNFNGGDDFFYKEGEIIRYHRRSGDLEKFYRKLLLKYNIQTVYMFGDCRPVHKAAIRVLKKLKIDFYVFEEGYLRPNYITLEKDGVNGYSSLPRDLSEIPDCVQAHEARDHVGYGKFRYMALYAFLYFFFGFLRKKNYFHYKHHKPFRLIDPYFWFLSFIRKMIYRFTEKKIARDILKNHKKNYFFVPLQVYNDTQISEHSAYRNVEAFLSDIIPLFAKNAPLESLLVIKHHPMDRGHRNYKKLIIKLSEKYGVLKRVRYLHEVNLPAMLKNALGVVLINSTLGLSSLYHGTPVKVFGRAFYDIKGLTSQSSRESFWKEPGAVCEKNFLKYRNFLASQTQLRGSFYNRNFFNKKY